MSEKGGKDFLLKVGQSDGPPETFVTLGGLRSTSFTRNNEAIDVTNHGSNQDRTLLDGAGIKSMSISGSGIHNGHVTTLDVVDDAVDSGTLLNFQVVDDDSGRTYQAAFKVVSFERAGDYNNEQSYSISLESSGAITVT